MSTDVSPVSSSRTSIALAPGGEPAAAAEVPARVGPLDPTRPPRALLGTTANPGLVLQEPGAAPSSNVRFPRNLCYNGDCGVEMQRIWNAFQAAGPVDLARLPRVFSGNVYWLASAYNANHAHHGGLVLDPQSDGGINFNARWSFFAPSNPYAATTLDEARAWSATHQSVEVRADHLYVDATPRTGDPRRAIPLEYWLREDPATRNLYVIGFFGNGQFAVGELTANR